GVSVEGLSGGVNHRARGRTPAAPRRSASFPTRVKDVGSVPFSVKEIGDRPLRKTPRYHVLTCLVPSSMVSCLAQGHRCLPSGDATPMIPQPTFTENGTDPRNFGEA